MRMRSEFRGKINENEEINQEEIERIQKGANSIRGLSRGGGIVPSKFNKHNSVANLFKV